MEHSFIFKPGRWTGKGTISFSMAEDVLEFYTEWRVSPFHEGKIFFHQIVQIKDFSEPTRNQFYIDEIEEKSFDIHLENQVVGKVHGKGVVTPTVIAWEFRDKKEEFDGFEIYEYKNGLYQMKAEFSAGEELKSFIKGYIEKET